MARNIKTTIYLDGGEKYQKQLKSINENLVNLSSQMNVATSTFNKNDKSILTSAKNFQSLVEQQEVLSRQITTQKEKVQVLSDVVAESTKNYVSAYTSLKGITAIYGENSDKVEKAKAVVERYRQQLDKNQNTLNNETATLNKLNVQYENNGKAITEHLEINSKHQKQLDKNQSTLNSETAVLNKVQTQYKDTKEKINSLNGGLEEMSVRNHNVNKSNSLVKAGLEALHVTLKALPGTLKVVETASKVVGKGLLELGKADLKALKDSVVAVGKALGGISTASLEAINKTVDISVKGFATYTKAVGETAKALGEMSVEKGMDFSSQMSNVQALMGNVDGTDAQNKEMEALKERAKEIGATTKFTATEVGQAYENMAKAGWKAQEMLNSISGVMSLSSASGEQLDTVTKVLTNSMTSLGYEVSKENATKFVDTLATVVTNANTNIEELGDAFRYVGSTGKTLGYTVEDLSVGLGLMANQGIVGEQAGNALKSGLQRLVNPTKSAQAVIDKLGISLVNSKGETASFNEVLLNLKKAFGTVNMNVKDSSGNLKDYETLMEEAQGSTKELQALQDAGALFGKQQVSNWLALIQSETEDYEQLTKAIENSECMAEKMSEVQLDNLTGDFTILKSAIEGVGLAIFDYIEQPLRDLTQTASEVTSNIQKNIEGGFNLNGIKVDITFLKNSIVDQFNGMSTEILNSINSFSTIFNTAIEELLSGAIEVAPTLIGDGLPLLTNSYWNLVSNLIEQVGASAPELINSGAKAINSFVTGLTSTSNTLKDAMPDILSALSDGISDILPNILNMGKSILSTITSGIVTALPEVLSIGTELLDYLNESLQDAPEFLNNLFDGLHDGLVNNFPALLESVSTLISSLLELITSDDTRVQITGLIRMLSDDLISTITEILPEIVSAMPGLLNTIIQPILNILTDGELLTTLMDSVIELISSLLVFIGNNAEGITSAVVNLVTSLSNALIENMDTILPAISQIIVGVVLGVSKNISALLESLLTLIGELALVLTSDEVLAPLLECVTTLISDVLFAIIENIQTLVNTIMEVARAVLQIFLEPKNLEALCELVSEVCSDIISAIPGLLGSILASAGYIITNVVQVFKDWLLKGDNWKGLGRGIIDGLVGGLEDAWENLSNALKNMGGKVIDAFKEIFDIHSPSKIMRDQIGKYLLPGVAEGVENTVGQTTSDVQKSIDKMVSGINVDGSINTITSKLSDDKFLMATDTTNAVIKAKGSDILPNTSADNSNSKNTTNYQNLFQGAVFNIYNDMDVEEIARKIQFAIQTQKMGVGVW